MASKAKKIPVGDGYSVQFIQRAKGCETPYWVGSIYRKGRDVGDFHNDGMGGSTCIRIEGDELAFDRMGRAAQEAVGHEVFEPGNDVIAWAEFVSYTLKCSTETFALADYVAFVWCAPCRWRIHDDRTDAQRDLYAAAEHKVYQLIAAQYAKKGKTMVLVDGVEYIYNSLDRAVVERSVTRRFAGKKCEIVEPYAA